jgi:uncharacterized membrane protein
MDLAIARAVHVLAVVLWIGGVGLVTTALLPALRGLPADQRLALFGAVERRFRTIARICVLLAGASGLYMLFGLDAWDRFTELSYWWMHAMVLVWLIFAAILFVLEPLMHRRGTASRSTADPDAMLRRMAGLHWILLTLSLLTIAGAVLGSHGVMLFG